MTGKPRTFIVRTWLESTFEHPAWRATATDTSSLERHHFSSLEALAWFLYQESGTPNQVSQTPIETRED